MGGDRKCQARYCCSMIMAGISQTVHQPASAVDGVYNRIKRAGNGPRFY